MGERNPQHKQERLADLAKIKERNKKALEKRLGVPVPPRRLSNEATSHRSPKPPESTQLSSTALPEVTSPQAKKIRIPSSASNNPDFDNLRMAAIAADKEAHPERYEDPEGPKDNSAE